MSEKRVQVLFNEQAIDGDSAVVKSGGCEFTDSAREIQRILKLTGEMGGATVTLSADFEDDDFAPVTNLDGSVIELTEVGVYEIFLAADMNLKATLSGSSGTTLVTLKLN